MSVNRKIIEFYDKQSNYKYIKSVKFYREIKKEGSCTNNLTVVMFDSLNEDSEFFVTFTNINEFSMKNLEGLLSAVISIEDISSYQMENIAYKVSEEENNVFSFSCEDFIFSVRSLL